MHTRAYGVRAADQAFEAIDITRRAPGPRDVQIDIAHCGICHSDLHTARAEWAGTHYPCVPGHEIVGKVSAVGDAVTRFKVGDAVGVGCMVASCKRCAALASLGSVPLKVPIHSAGTRVALFCTQLLLPATLRPSDQGSRLRGPQNGTETSLAGFSRTMAGVPEPIW